MATKANPTYTASIVDGETTYDITPVLIRIETSEQEDQMAQKAVVTIMNTMIGGQWSTSVFKTGQRMFIYADDGEKQDEVFRGFIWTKNYTSSNSTREFALTCYDNLIYFQESEVYYYFSSGKSTEDVLRQITEAWGINFAYNYESITHEKLVLKGTLSNIFMDDLLNLVRDRTGKKYVIRMEKDTLNVTEIGKNTTIYQFNSRENVMETKSQETMDGMITRVVIFGKQGESERAPVEATVEEHIEEYGTLQKVYGRNESQSLEDAKKEADTLVNLHKWPFQDFEIDVPDVPWIRKGDVIYINAGDIYQQYLMITSISRDISNDGAKMHIACNNGVPREYQTSALSSSISSESKSETETATATEGGGTPGSISDGPVSGSQQEVVSSAWSTGTQGWNRCALWVNMAFQNAGLSRALPCLSRPPRRRG